MDVDKFSRNNYIKESFKWIKEKYERKSWIAN